MDTFRPKQVIAIHDDRDCGCRLESVQNLIRENKSYRITSAIQTGHKYGMNLLDEHLLALFRKGVIKYSVALGQAQMPDEFEQNAKALGADTGSEQTGPEEMAGVLE